MANNKSFTVIEILVCLIIALTISAFLVSAVGGARKYARRVQCANNLRQIGMAIDLYVDDNNNRLIPSRQGVEVAQVITWHPDLEPYIDDLDLFRCPSYKYHQYESLDRSSYGYNYLGLTETTELSKFIHTMQGIHITSVTSAAECIMVTDSGNQGNPTYSDYYVNKTSKLDPRHSGGINILFVDGHVKWMHPSDIPISGAQSTTWWNY